LEVAEFWIGSRPAGAPEPTADIRDYVAASRQGVRSAQRLRRMALGSILALMMAVILGLVGWINQSYLVAEWHWWSVVRPYAVAQVWPYVLSATKEQSLKPGDPFKECAQDCPEMIVVPAGSFIMGSPAGQGEDDEHPQHKVTIGKPFAVSKYEVTFADWDACAGGGGCDGYKPYDQGWGRGQQPVMNVNWHDAQQYVAWLSQVTGKTYRLLSDAEYEYAARAGTQTAYPWGDDATPNGKAMANCGDCNSKWAYEQTAPVGSFPPNKFGLYDMVGNVFEWTQDCVNPDLLHASYNGAPVDGSAWISSGNCNYRILRGAYYSSTIRTVRSADRVWHSTDDRGNDMGFRVARVLLAP
jgi:formylglycine-generating enzyme required for sulfatase activity